MTGQDENVNVRRGPDGWRIGVDLPAGSSVTVETLQGTQETRLKAIVPVESGRFLFRVLMGLLWRGLKAGLTRRRS